jgi:signal transduction histidine kinase
MAVTPLGVSSAPTGATRPLRQPTTSVAGVAAVVLGACAVAFVATAAPEESRADRAILEALIIGVPVAVGWYASRYEHSRRFGLLLIGAGCVWSLTALAESSASLPYSVGRVSAWLIFPLLIYLMLAYPRGRLAPGLDRALYGSTSALIALLFVGSALFVEAYPTHTPWAGCRLDCPANAFLVLGSEPAFLGDVVQPLREALAIALLSAVTYSMASRLRAATPLGRRVAGPVVVMSTLSIVVVAAFLVARRLAPDGDAASVIGWIWALCVPGIAAAFFVGLLRRRLLLGGRLGELSAALSRDPEPSQMRDALAATLDDPTVELLVPDDVPGRWRDSQGRATLRLAAAKGGRALTLIHDDGEPLALLAHDPLLRDDGDLLAAMSALVLGSLHRRRVTSRLASSLEELDESRKRIARAADIERSRIERDLHDGAQQRLIMMRIKLSIAEELTQADPAAGAAALHEIGTDVDLAIEELRSLAHGVYPSVLSDRGLEDALRSVVAESPLTIHLEARGIERHPAEIETAVYFMCLEAIQNVTKHADGATGVWITLKDPGLIYVEVRDDGQGFMPAGSGANGGLGNMRDRVEAVGGRLTIDASPGRGARIRGVIPLP